LNHIRHTHPEIKSEAAKLLEAKYSNVLLSPSEIPDPPANSNPIPFLPIISGHSCPSCGSHFPKWTLLARHLRADHESVFSQKDCPPARLQTWYTGAETRFFPVQDNQHSSPTTSPHVDGRYMNSPSIINNVNMKLQAHMQVLKQGDSFSLAAGFSTEADSDAFENPHLDPWLEKTRWVEYFQGIRLARVAEVRTKLGELVVEGGPLFPIHRAVGSLLQDCFGLIPNVSQALLFAVRQVTANEERAVPFRCPQTHATHKRYVKCWQDFICFLVLQSAPVFSQYHLRILSMTPTQSELVSQIAYHLPHLVSGPSLTPNRAEYHPLSLTDLIKNLSLACIEQDVWDNGFQSPMIHYLAVLGINQNTSAYHDAYSYTGYLASIAYCARLLMIQSCTQLSNASLASDNRLSPLQVFMEQKARYMRANRESVMSIVFDQLGYGLAIQMRSGGSRLVVYSEEHDMIIFSGEPISVKMIREVLQKTLSRAKKILTDSLFIPENFEDTLTSIIPTLRDDTSCALNGASIASQNPEVVVFLQEQIMGQFLKVAYSDDSSDRNSEIFISGTEKISPVARSKFERSRVLFLEYLLLLMHMTGGGPPRGTEMSTLQFANSRTRHRNVLLLGGELLFVTSYHKGQSRYGTQKYIPRFLPHAVGRLLLAYLLYLVPFESISLPRIYSWPQLSVERSHMLWSCNSGIWGTEKLTKVLRRECSQTLGTGITTSSWRHISIAIMRHWIQNPYGCENSDNISDTQDSEDASELQAGHSTEVANLKYACRMDICDTLTSRSIRVFSAVSHDWHTFLQLREDRSRNDSGNSFAQSQPRNSYIHLPKSSPLPCNDEYSAPFNKRKFSKEVDQSDGKRYVNRTSHFTTIIKII